jgi:hypothetical protein
VSYTLAFALQLRIKHRKTSVRVARPYSFHENWQSERHTLLKGVNESLIVFSALVFQFVSNFGREDVHKMYLVLMSFVKIISGKATFYLVTLMNLHLFLPLGATALGEPCPPQ